MVSEDGKAKGRSPLAAIRRSLFGEPLTEVLEGLRAEDTDTRVAAAAKLRRVVASDTSGMVDEAAARLNDPIPAVRFHAIAALAGRKEGRKLVVALVRSTSEADARTRTSMLADLAGIAGADSPFRGKGQTAQVLSYGTPEHSDISDDYSRRNLFHDVLWETKSAEEALPILMAAALSDMMPCVWASWVMTLGFSPLRLDIDPDWPDQCCVCGATHPAGSEVSYEGSFWTPMQKDTRTHVRGTLVVPVCGGGSCRPPKLNVGGAGIGVKFPSPHFVAELLYPDSSRGRPLYQSKSKWHLGSPGSRGD